MMDSLIKVIAALVCACFFFVGTFKTLGVMQQAGYKTGGFWRWTTKKENTLGLRLCCWGLLLLFSVGIVSLCFSFAGTEVALCLTAVPFLGLSLLYCYADRKHALKVPLKGTGRVKRLAAVYFFLLACLTYGVIALSAFFYQWAAADGAPIVYALWQYLPVTLLPWLTPFVLTLANWLTAPFENLRNRLYVKKAAKKIAEKEGKTVAVVGSYGKTSVKRILTTLLSQKYAVCATPASFNTPMGLAKTAMSEEFDKAEVFIAEMGARRIGDIAELCKIASPDYALFTGVCAQHIASFGSLDKVKQEKCTVFKSGAKSIVCALSLKEDVKEIFEGLTDEEKGKITFLTGEEIEDLKLCFNATKFTLSFGEESWAVDVPLLGKHSAENIALCVCLAKQMGLSREEIAKGLAALQPIEHRLQLLESNGVYILDDAYNANERGAAEAVEALTRFEGRKTVVTPGLVEAGTLEKELGEKLGKILAEANLDQVILVGDTQVAPVKNGYLAAGGDKEKIRLCFSLDKAKEALQGTLQAGDAVLFLNDLPDVY
ncbi:MAG: UDP-N-acetylmuramoyl-tripeptide--D-alanyl-D-alanine ligase [Clostridia bacterium]|nr:UDP-N-acetylmuramoyl-tripeptide--D-alanyl-D-alanine ligase [Clostridia bacterium]